MATSDPHSKRTVTDPKRLRRLGPNHLLTDTQGIAMLLSRSAPTGAMVLQVQTLIEQLAPQYPQSVGVLHVALDDRDEGAFAESARAAIASSARRSMGHIGAFVIVVPREGFSAAVVRSVASGVMLAVRPKFPARSFATPVEGIAFLCDALDRVRPGPVDRAALSKSVDEALAELRRE